MRADVKAVTDRRPLQFTTVDDILEDVQQLDRAESRRATGNWTPAQNVEHIAMFIEFSLDGFPFKAPLPLRMIGPMFRKMVTTKPMKPGIRAPKNISAFEPKPSVQWDDALQKLQSAVERVRRGDQMNVRSPLFGKMSHDNWTKLHCRHAELHLSFIHQQQ